MDVGRHIFSVFWFSLKNHSYTKLPFNVCAMLYSVSQPQALIIMYCGYVTNYLLRNILSQHWTKPDSSPWQCSYFVSQDIKKECLLLEFKRKKTFSYKQMRELRNQRSSKQNNLQESWLETHKIRELWPKKREPENHDIKELGNKVDKRTIKSEM